MGSDRDDELARTATAPVGTSTAPATPVEPIGATLGRYRLERELGAGGMGVVHAAFDPDLERRIALKVLRRGGAGSSSDSDDAQKRLLREARAMARLTHPNVVTVHEVGSAGGRDYVAMELVEGETLAEWLRSAQRAEDEIIDALFAAGRGLAAAHAAGIVHRDFKPHNVLRHKHGRIVVTDFGLAREAHADPMAVTRPLKQEPDGTATPTTTTPSTPLAGLTMTGSVLGTPAYMAPEQWTGGTVSPSTDQFAYCVALWEALAGERPFRGPTIEELREQVQRGPAELDDSKLPRRLRRALRRGLDPDPKRRWPSMDALLAAMTRSERRPGIALTIAGLAVVAAAVVYVAVRDEGATAPAAATCQEPAHDLEAVWAAGAAAKLAAAGQAANAELIEADARAWRAKRAQVCATAATDPTHRDRLACLDGVLARLDAVARAVEQLGDLPNVDAGDPLIDPGVCEAATPPRLITTVTPQFREVITSRLREKAIPGPFPAAPARALVERVKSDPCAAALARLRPKLMQTPADRDRQLAESMQDTERCGDDRVRAEVAVVAAAIALESSSLGAAVTSKLRLAEVASQRVPQPDVTANIDLLRARIAQRADSLEEAIARAEAAMAGYAARGRIAQQIAAGMVVLELRQERATDADFATLEPSLREWRELAVDKLGPHSDTVRELDRGLAWWAYSNGDVAGAHARLQALRRAVPNDPARKITGRVVDERDRPVAGATVAAGVSLNGDSIGVAVPTSESMRVATTGADGSFEIADAPDHGVVIAQLAERRSRPVALADSVTLKLAPTSRLEGRVDLRGDNALSVIVVAVDPSSELRYASIAPVGPDGSFVLDGVPRGELNVMAAQKAGASFNHTGIVVKVNAPVVRGLALGVVHSKRVVHVVVRSTIGAPVVNAAVIVLPGTHASMTVRTLKQTMRAGSERLARQIEGEHAPPAVMAVARPGDVFATMSKVPEAAASACVLALPSDLGDAKLQEKIDGNLDKLELSCVPIPETAQVVEVEAPPWPRLD